MCTYSHLNPRRVGIGRILESYANYTSQDVRPSFLQAFLQREAWFYSLVAKPTSQFVVDSLWNLFSCFQLWSFRLFNHKAKCLSVAWQRNDPQRRIHSIIYDRCPPEEQKSETQTKTSSYEVDELPSGKKLRLKLFRVSSA